MNQGIRPNPDTDLGHLDLAPDTLSGAMDMFRGDGGFTDLDTRAITQEVRKTLEDVIELLTEALPARYS